MKEVIIVFSGHNFIQMSIGSTYFIKAQIPGTTIDHLLKLYEREILIRGAGQTAINGNTVEFSGNSGILSWYGHGQEFAHFSEGRLVIEETETTFEVYLEAQSPKWILLFDVFFTSLRNDMERELQSEG